MQKEDAYTLDDLLEKAKVYIKSDEDIELIKKAYLFASKAHAGQLRLTGDDYMLHPLNVALILTEIYADAQTLSAALLHDVINFANVTIEEIEKEFGPEMKALVDGISRINKLSLSADNEALVSYHKKILVGLSGDVRIIILKIADRLHNMRTLWAIPENKRKEKAKETLEILVPIAHRLGINHIKSELEDLSLKYWKPDVYNDILEKLSESRAELDKSVDKMMESVSKILDENNIPHEMKGRSKSVYSIYNKLQKGKTFNEIYDILALRYFVNTVSDCYLALGAIHAKYKPMPKRFKDYIARPKANGYQSLHTTVFGVDGKLFEIQIRTYEMDKIAEYGIASHWSYKEHKDGATASKDIMEQKLQIFRNIIELNEDSSTPEEFVSSVKKDILSSDVIYVYTPKGDVIELPEGSTPVDFAYKVHSEVGDRMIGAIVNDNIVPLDYKLNTGDIIKINTNKASTPSKDWLSFVVTTGAKNKIRAYFSRLEKDENIEKGSDALEKELRKNNLSINEFLTNKNIDIILDELKLKDIDDLYVNIALGKYTPNQIIKIVNKPEEEKIDIAAKINETNYSKTSFSNNDVLVEGMNEIKASLSSCCKPIPGDNIIGYITRGSGITVHRSTCRNIIDIDERLINVKWNDNVTKKYPSDILVYTNTFDNLLDIITKASSSGIIIDSISTINKSDYKVYNMTVLVENKDKLEKFINDLLNLNFVQKVERSVN